MTIFPNVQPTTPGGGSNSSSPPATPRKKPPIPQSARWKPTAEEQVELEDLTYNLLSSGFLKTDIKKYLRKWAEKKEKALQTHYPGIVIEMDARTVERYLSRARERMVAESGKTKDELRQDSLSFYLAIARDPTADHRSKLIARERIDRLYGLDMPIKVAPTDPTGEQSYQHLSESELEARILDLIAQAGEGNAGRSDGGTQSPSATESQN